MPRVAAWRRYLTFWRTPVTQDVDDELRFHTNMRVNELIARGMPEDEAHRAVAERLGDMNAVQSACVELSEVRERNKRNAALLDAFHSDLRYAIRGLRATTRLRGGHHRHARTRHRCQRRGVFRRRSPAFPHRADVARCKSHASHLRVVSDTGRSGAHAEHDTVRALQGDQRNARLVRAHGGV